MSSDLASARNVAFVGHSSAGKTSLIDAFAHALGATERKGSVADKTSLSDTEPEEQEKGHTFQLKLVYAQKGGQRWNLIDTPGYPEFGADALSAMYATELVVGVATCAGHVSYNLRNKLQQAKALGRARAIFVTHVDAENANFDELVEEMQRKLGPECVPLYLPDKSGRGFAKVQPA